VFQTNSDFEPPAPEHGAEAHDEPSRHSRRQMTAILREFASESSLRSSAPIVHSQQ